MVRKIISYALVVILTLVMAVGFRQYEMPKIVSDEAEPENVVIEEKAADVSNKNEKPIKIIENKKEEAVKEEVFPKGVNIEGIDISGMTAKAAEEAFDKWAKGYTFYISVNGDKRVYNGSEIGISFQKPNFGELVKTCKRNEEIKTDISCDENSLSNVLDKFPNAVVEAQDAKLLYDSSLGKFVLEKEKDGKKLEIGTIKDAVKEAILSRQEGYSGTVTVKTLKPSFVMDSDKARNALSKANAMLDISLTYTYTPSGKSTQKESVSRSSIASFLYIGSGGTSVEIDSDVLRSYCERMSDKHSVSAGKSNFITTAGYAVNISVPSSSEMVDVDKLFKDIKKCILNGISGVRTAPYKEVSANFNGSYIEIDLTAQHMWLYVGGECIVSTDIVSGCVNTGCATPTGLYSIYSKVRHATLVGDDYETPVDYWMAINGGIGIHDSVWRSEYGGTIYKYDGSHGCINTPYNAVATIYENTRVGYPVVVHGGVNDVAPMTQSLKGTTSYTVSTESPSFKLDAKPKYDTTLTYSSSNTDVVSVSSNGTVTINGKGKAKITVTAKKKTGYTSATLTVNITVKYPCEISGEHTWDEGVVTTLAEVGKEGVITYTCIHCGKTKTEVIPAIEPVEPPEDPPVEDPPEEPPVTEE